MKGLLLKDFLIIREGLLIMFFTMVAIGIGMVILVSPWVLTVIAGVSLSMTAVTTIQNDKTTQWDKFSATLPVSRAQIISSKYFMYLLLGLVGIALGILFSVVVSIWKQDFDGEQLLLYLSVAVMMSFLPGSISIPLSFILDEEKGMVGLILSYLVTSGLFAVIALFLNRVLHISLLDHLATTCGIVAAISAVVYIASWIFCSKKLCHKIF